MGKRKTHEEYLNEVKFKFNGKIEVIGEYVDGSTRIDVKCKECGNEWNPVSKELVRKRTSTGCPRCAASSQRLKVSLTKEEFETLLHNRHKGNIEIIGDYNGSVQKSMFKCKTCEDVWRTRSSYMLGEQCSGCYKCNKNKRMTREQIDGMLVSRGIKIISAYKKRNESVNFECQICFHMWEGKLQSTLANNSICRKCADKKRTKTTDEFSKELLQLVGNEYKLIGEYYGKAKSIVLKHERCQSKWKTTPNSFLRNARCPNCKRSRGEDRITEFLRVLNIKMKSQLSFNNCRLKRVLPFDVGIINEDKQIGLLIEFDGKQHFEPVKYWGGENEFKIIQQRDMIKNDYCLSNNIPLLRIPYWDYNNIETILTEKLTELNLIHRSEDLIDKKL